VTGDKRKLHNESSVICTVLPTLSGCSSQEALSGHDMSHVWEHVKFVPDFDWKASMEVTNWKA
jgi:hypothetical protein